MKEYDDINRKIQQLELYLNDIVSTLSRGELPVNLKPVTKIVDSPIIATTPVLDLSQDRLVEVYNDMPQLLVAYAVDVTLSAESYRGEIDSIMFYRFHRGNYWIIATKELDDRAWLVPNPLKSISFKTTKSLSASFDREILDVNRDSDDYFLVKPALVQILPVIEPLTWKLLERGVVGNMPIYHNEHINNLLNELNRKIIDSEEKYNALAATIKQELDIHLQHLNNLDEKTVKIETKNKFDRLLLTRELDCHQDDINIIKQTISSGLNKPSIFDLSIDRGVETDNIVPIDLIDTQLTQAPSPPIYQSINSEYYHNANDFASKYNAILVSVTKESIERVWSRDEDKTIFFEENNRGNYWLFKIDRILYLVPVADKYINQHSYTTTALSFDCHNYTPDYQKIQLIKPAIVTFDPHTNPRTWRLQEQGKIFFL